MKTEVDLIDVEDLEFSLSNKFMFKEKMLKETLMLFYESQPTNNEEPLTPSRSKDKTKLTLKSRKMGVFELSKKLQKRKKNIVEIKIKKPEQLNEVRQLLKGEVIE